MTLLGAEDTLRSKEMNNIPPPPDWKTEFDFIHLPLNPLCKF